MKLTLSDQNKSVASFLFEINGSGPTPDLVYTNVRTSEEQRFKNADNFCKKDAHNEIKRDLQPLCSLEFSFGEKHICLI